jgi:integrase
MSAGVVKRGNRWTFVIDLPRDPQTGRRRQIRRTFRTEREAKAARAQLISDVHRGHTPSRRSLTFGECAAQWLEIRSRSVRPITVSAYSAALKHAVAAFGRKRLGDVARLDVERLADGLHAAGRSRRTCALVLFVTRSVFSSAVDEGYLTKNVAAKVQASGTPAKTREALTADEMAALRAHAVSTDMAATWALVFTGIRRSEVLGARWGDLDVASGTLSVARGVVPNASGGRAEPTGPKTARGRRSLPLSADTIGALRAERERQARLYGLAQARDGFVALDPAGVPLRPERLSDLWADLCRDAGIRVVPLHSMRHTAATLALDSELALRQVAAWLGQDPAVLARVYDHPDRDQLAAVGQALSAAE